MFINNKDLNRLKVSSDLSIKDSIKILEEERKGIVIVTEDNNKIKGTVTDGDIRRAILKGLSFDESIKTIMNKSPVTSSLHNEAELNKLSIESNLESIPIINEKNELVALYSLMPSSLSYQNSSPSKKYKNIAAFIMAGGEGKRMRPITLEKPKPLVHIGKKSLLQRNIDLIKKANIKEIYISVNYMADKIIEEIGDGKNTGININYIKEEKKLGTGAPLGLITEHSFDHILIINADILTSLSLSKLISAHVDSKSDASIVITEKNTQIPFGVIEIDENEKPIKIVEKPKIKHFCAAGIYMLTSEVTSKIDGNDFKDMPDILNELIKMDKVVNVFPLFPSIESWSDIGTKEALDEANKFQ